LPGQLHQWHLQHLVQQPQSFHFPLVPHLYNHCCTCFCPD
jgi:hypothetical protein